MNAVDIEVFRALFQSIAEEMGVVLTRAAFSPNIKERRDHSCAVFDGTGRLVAQAAHIPVHLGSMPASVAAALESVAMTPGVTVILNDPFRGGTHLPDVTLVTPVFAAGESTNPLFFVANRAHHADVGGISPGSLPLSRHIDDEGFRLGPTVLTAEVVAAFAGASRVPQERLGDLSAQRAANALGARRLEELVARRGAAVLGQAVQGLLDYSERLMRRVIGNVPDGAYSAQDTLDADYAGGAPLELAVTVTVAGEHCRCDFSATGDQVAGPLNAVRAITESAVCYVMRCLAPDELPMNAGCMRPVRVVTRPGSLCDALEPAAVAGGNVETSQRLVDVLLRAFAQALPERIPAASAGSMSNVTMGSQTGSGRPFVYYETIGGGSGAGPGWRGTSGVHTHMTNTRNTPIEALEHAFPLRIRAYHLRDGSGGAGRHRGGDGIVREYETLEPTIVTTLCDRQRSRPWSLAGGEPGTSSQLTIIARDGTAEIVSGRMTRTLLPGERLRVETPGGGGHGLAEQIFIAKSELPS